MRKKIIHRITFKINVISPLLFLLFCFISMLSYGVNIEVVPTLIEFDYKEGYADDALQIFDNNGKLIEDPEWDGVNPSHNCAYIMGQSKRKIKVYFNSNYSGNMNLIINLSYSNLENGIGKICNLFIPNYNGQECVLELSGTLPQSVGKHTFTWNWDIYAMPTEPSSYCAFSKPSVTTHTYYTLLDLPKAPMAIPWEGVLEKACVWAGGQLESASIAEKVVEGLYNNTGFLYDVESGDSRYTTGGNEESFDLKTMLSEIGGIGVTVNCYDMGKALTIFINALGCNSQYAYCEPFGYVNCIKPIGRDWTNNPLYLMGPPYSNIPVVGEDNSESSVPSRSYFRNHAFCILESVIYDACIKVDTDANSDTIPCLETWIKGWEWSVYKDKVIDKNPQPLSPGNYVIWTFNIDTYN